MKKTYFAQQTGWLLGAHRQKGAPVEASDEEAKYALLAGTLGEEKPPTAEEQKAATAAANETDADRRRKA